MNTILKYVFYAVIIVIIYLVGRGIYESNISKQNSDAQTIDRINPNVQSRASYNQKTGQNDQQGELKMSQNDLNNDVWEKTKETSNNAWDATKEGAAKIGDAVSDTADKAVAPTNAPADNLPTENRPTQPENRTY